MSEPSSAILTLDGLSVRLPAGADRPHALSGVSLSIAANEILCVVGESGSGKSIMANAIMRLLPNEVSHRWRPRDVRRPRSGGGHRRRDAAACAAPASR